MNPGKITKTPPRGWTVGVLLCALLGAMSGCVSTKPSNTQQALDALTRARETQAPHTGLLAAPGADEARVRHVLARWVNALGGGRRVAAVKNIRCLVAIAEGVSVHYIRTTEAQAGLYRYELVGAESLLCGGYNGIHTWQRRGTVGASLQPGLIGAPYWTSLCFLTQRLEKAFPRRGLLPEEVVDGKLCSVLAMSPADGTEERWYFDVGDGLLKQIVRRHSEKQATVLRYSNYRAVSRVMVPHDVAVTEPDGSAFVFRTVTAELATTGSKESFSPPEELGREQAEINAILKKNLALGLGRTTEGRACRTFATMFSPSTGSQTRLLVSRRKPGLVLVEKNSPGAGLTVCGFDGKIGWENSEILGYHVMKDAEINELFSLSWLGCDPYLAERFPLRIHEGTVNEDGRELVRIRMRNTNGLTGLFVFEKETGRLVRGEIEENPKAGIQAIKVEYGDYRAVDTLTMPFRVAYRSGGIETVITCDKVELDVELPDSLFQPRTETD